MTRELAIARLQLLADSENEKRVMYFLHEWMLVDPEISSLDQLLTEELEQAIKQFHVLAAERWRNHC